VIAARIKDDALNQQRKLVSGAIENIGEEPTFSLLDEKRVVRKEKIVARDYNQAMEALPRNPVLRFSAHFFAVTMHGRCARMNCPIR
jgi:hypothetical protein